MNNWIRSGCHGLSWASWLLPVTSLLPILPTFPLILSSCSLTPLFSHSSPLFSSSLSGMVYTQHIALDLFCLSFCLSVLKALSTCPLLLHNTHTHSYKCPFLASHFENDTLRLKQHPLISHSRQTAYVSTVVEELSAGLCWIWGYRHRGRSLVCWGAGRFLVSPVHTPKMRGL